MLLDIIKTAKKLPNATAELRSIRIPSFDRNRKAHVAVLGVLPSFYGKLKQYGYQRPDRSKAVFEKEGKFDICPDAKKAVIIYDLLKNCGQKPKIKLIVHAVPSTIPSSCDYTANTTTATRSSASPTSVAKTDAGMSENAVSNDIPRRVSPSRIVEHFADEETALCLPVATDNPPPLDFKNFTLPFEEEDTTLSFEHAAYMCPPFVDNPHDVYEPPPQRKPGEPWSRGRFGWTQIVTDLLSGKEGLDPSALNKRIEGKLSRTLPQRFWRCNGKGLEVFIPTEDDLKSQSICNDMVQIKRGRFCDEHMKSDGEWNRYQKLVLMKRDLYAAMKRRRAEDRVSIIGESQGGLNQNVLGYNLYEFARRFLNFRGNLEQFLTDPRHGPFAMKSKLLVCILQYHKENEANGFVEEREKEGNMTTEQLRELAKKEIEARLIEGFDVFYFSIGGEHKMRPDTPQRTGADLEIARTVGARGYLRHANQTDSYVGIDEVHRKIFPKEKRFRLMRAAIRSNAEQYEPILIETALQYHREGKIVLLNRVRGENATRANLRRSQCGCYLYTEVWGSFTTKADLASDGYEIV